MFYKRGKTGYYQQRYQVMAPLKKLKKVIESCVYFTQSRPVRFQRAVDPGSNSSRHPDGARRDISCALWLAAMQHGVLLNQTSRE